MHPTLRRDYYPLLMFNALPGADNNLKFERIFSNAPIWLLNFTGTEWDAKLLGFKLPELVGAPALGEEARLDRNNWPFLPEGTIDCEGPCSELDESWKNLELDDWEMDEAWKNLEPDEPWEKFIERRCRELSPDPRRRGVARTDATRGRCF